MQFTLAAIVSVLSLTSSVLALPAPSEINFEITARAPKTPAQIMHDKINHRHAEMYSYGQIAGELKGKATEQNVGDCQRAYLNEIEKKCSF